MSTPHVSEHVADPTDFRTSHAELKIGVVDPDKVDCTFQERIDPKRSVGAELRRVSPKYRAADRFL